jgi:N-acetylglucosamine-6-phosphate deacetylase
MSDLTAITGARIFDGHGWHDDAALLVEFGHVCGIVGSDSVPAHSGIVHLDGGILVPGFIDLQVNGGGGVLFNNAPTLESIRTICAAHSQFGTTALLPTLITDTVDVKVFRASSASISKARTCRWPARARMTRR